MPSSSSWYDYGSDKAKSYDKYSSQNSYTSSWSSWYDEKPGKDEWSSSSVSDTNVEKAKSAIRELMISDDVELEIAALGQFLDDLDIDVGMKLVKFIQQELSNEFETIHKISSVDGSAKMMSFIKHKGDSYGRYSSNAENDKANYDRDGPDDVCQQIRQMMNELLTEDEKTKIRDLVKESLQDFPKGRNIMEVLKIVNDTFGERRLTKYLLKIFVATATTGVRFFSERDKLGHLVTYLDLVSRVENGKSYSTGGKWNDRDSWYARDDGLEGEATTAECVDVQERSGGRDVAKENTPCKAGHEVPSVSDREEEIKQIIRDYMVSREMGYVSPLATLIKKRNIDLRRECGMWIEDFVNSKLGTEFRLINFSTGSGIKHVPVIPPAKIEGIKQIIRKTMEGWDYVNQEDVFAVFEKEGMPPFCRQFNMRLGEFIELHCGDEFTHEHERKHGKNVRWICRIKKETQDNSAEKASESDSADSVSTLSKTNADASAVHTLRDQAAVAESVTEEPEIPNADHTSQDLSSVPSNDQVACPVQSPLDFTMSSTLHTAAFPHHQACQSQFQNSASVVWKLFWVPVSPTISVHFQTHMARVSTGPRDFMTSGYSYGPNSLNELCPSTRSERRLNSFQTMNQYQ